MAIASVCVSLVVKNIKREKEREEEEVGVSVMVPRELLWVFLKS